MTNQTPRPWFRLDTPTYAEIRTDGRESPIALVDDADNADMIVRGADSFDELVAAVEYVLDHIADPNRGPRDLYPAFGLDSRRAIEMCRAVLAKARG